PAQRGMQVVRTTHRLQLLADALATDGVVALGKRSDDRRLVREVLVERTEGNVRPLDDVAHAKRIASLFDQEFFGTGEDLLEALATARLRRGKPGDPRRGRRGLGRFSLRFRHLRDLLTSRMREFIV